MFHRAILLAGLLLLPRSISAYKIDSSCTKAGIENDVRDAMTSAFEMVDSSIARLNDSPYTVETVDLIRRLFIGKPGQLPTQRFRMTKVRQIFADIKENYEEEITGAGGVSNKDVIIYCDLSRYKEFDKKKDLWLDQTTKELVKYKEQQCKGSVADFFALAVTRNPETSEVVSDDDIPDEELYWDEKPTQIQLCPWFVDWVKSKEFKTASDVKKRTKIGRVVIKLVESKNFGLKQIDAFSLLDKVLLHEMTHGRSAWLAYKEGTRITGTADVRIPFLGVFGQPAYGWTNVRKLAQNGEDVTGVTDWKLKAADNNADSYALFGSAAKLLDDILPKRVDDNGRIVPIVYQGT